MNEILTWSLKLILKLKIVHAKLWMRHNCTTICMGALQWESWTVSCSSCCSHEPCDVAGVCIIGLYVLYTCCMHS